MGVPKFYRWLSERYACLSQVIKDHQIPEFDNLYLDMNGIIHPCSHPNDDDPHFRITEEQIFSNIFHYIEVLFRIIKPQKVFFMAVDGVAPRAKMNQQRGRRFRSAREAEENIRKALKKGEVLPTEERFDSNCITPGTEFMVKLHEQLKYFVNKKITTDPGWQKIQIYLSGHETPGEGEHKIMDFIRYERSQPGYDPNTRHCLYGLDADLIMLGLTSHDPHFSLLREEIRFGKNVKRVNNPEDITFHLLHLSLLREYIDWEFDSLKTKISFGYDLEKIIDDWILMGFLVGNDFVPNLPNFHINHDALPYLWQVYKDVMPTLDGYLHDGGLLSLARFQSYLGVIAKFDLEKFEEAYVDLKWLEGKTGGQGSSDSPFNAVDVRTTRDELEKVSLGSTKNSRKLRDYLAEKGVLEEAEQVDGGDFTDEHEKYKLRYYNEKFEEQLQDIESPEEFVDELCFKYVEAIQWILHYYFNGVPSWGWFFPYHYAPYVSDIKDCQSRPLTFDIGKAFLPFEQLLAVLPAASKKLLPEPFQRLMIMDNSKIIDYYPLEFKTDLNGKRQDWEAVVLIPFIDEKRLLEAMEPLYPSMNQSEKNRNRHSACFVYTYDAERSEKYPTSLPGVFPDLECCRASSGIIPIDKYRLSPDQIVKGLLPDVKLDIYFAGFPTLKHVAHSGQLRKIGVKVFQMHSRGESMVLTIDESDEPDVKELADSLLAQECYVGWPHLVEAFVTSVSDGKKKFVIVKDSPENVKEGTLTASDISAWKKQASCEKHSYLERKAVDVGMVHVLVEACQIQGKKYICGAKGAVHLEKQWSDWPVAFPFQVTVKNIDSFDETDSGAVCSDITDLFPVGTECFMMAIPHYGSSGKVIEVDVKQNRVRVQLTVVPEPDLVSLINNENEFTDVYYPAHVMAKRLGVSSHVLGQITGKVFLTKGKKEGSSKSDIGLNLKFSKQDKEVLGYARRCDGKWNYSPKTERTISIYQEKYPQVFDALSNSSSPEVHKVSEVFPDSEQPEILSEVESWLKTLPSHNQKAVKCGSSTLDEPVVKQIEEAVEKLKSEKQNKKNVKVRVKPTVLYRPMEHMGQVPPDPVAEFELFDRVVNVRTLGVAPYGLKGTIVGIHQGETEKDVNYEVLFDEPFMGGRSMRGTFENKLFVVQAWSLLNLSHGTRLELKKKGLPSPHAQQRRSGHLLEGAPADYKPSGKGGSYYMPESLGAWQTPLRVSSPEQRHGGSPNRFSPRGRFPSPQGNSPTYQRPRYSPNRNSLRGQTPPFRPRIMLNRQNFSPPGSGYSPRPHQSPGSRMAADSSGASSSMSAKESEHMIRQLLHMDGQPGSDQNLSYPETMVINPDYTSPMPPMSPTSPVLSSAPSGVLAMACREQGWPPPSFSHHRLFQNFITTVCVAGKLFQGYPCGNIVESTDSAATFALMTCGLLPQSFPFQPTPMNNGSFSFPSPSSPYTPPAYTSRSPTTRYKGPEQNRPSKHENPKGQPQSENSQATTPVSDNHDKDPKCPTNPPLSTVKVGDEPKSDSANGQRKDIFIPLQVSLNRKGVSSVPKSKPEEAETPKLPEPQSENSQATTPVSDNHDKDPKCPTNPPLSTVKVGDEPKSDSSNGQRKDIFIPLQVSLNRKAVSSVPKSKPEEAETPKLPEPQSENSQATTPVSDNHDKDPEYPTNPPLSTVKVGDEPKSDSSNGQRKDIFIPLQVSLNRKAVSSVPKSKPEEAETPKLPEPDVNEALPSPPENKTTPKSTKAPSAKGKPKLLAPSFFRPPSPKN